MFGKYKKYLTHIGTPENVQNICLKLSGFGFNKTIPGKWWESLLSVKSSSNSEIRFAVL